MRDNFQHRHRRMHISSIPRVSAHRGESKFLRQVSPAVIVRAPLLAGSYILTVVNALRKRLLAPQGISVRANTKYRRLFLRVLRAELHTKLYAARAEKLAPAKFRSINLKLQVKLVYMERKKKRESQEFDSRTKSRAFQRSQMSRYPATVQYDALYIFKKIYIIIYRVFQS